MIFASVLVAISLLQFVNVKPIKASNSTKCHPVCACLHNSTTLDCSNHNFTSIPQDLPAETKVLLLKNNKIENLTNRDFDGLSSLTKVDLTGNKINCGCSLNWTKDEKFTIKLIATCHSPSWIKGRSLANITINDMCSAHIPSTPPVAKTSVHKTMPGSTKTHSATTMKIPTTKQAVVLTESPRTTDQPVTSQAVTTRHPTTVVLQTTTVEIKTTSERVITTVQPQTTVEQQTTTFHSQTTTKQTDSDLASSPTQRPTSLVPTSVNNTTDVPNLTSLLNLSARKELSAESLKSAIKILESAVSRRNNSDSTTTMKVLLISSNLMRKDNRKTWSTVDKNFSGGEKILNVVNKAMRNHALWILKSSSNDSQHVRFNYTNLDAEIQVGIGEEMASKEILFPSSKSPEEDYVKISGSSFKLAGKNKVAVLGIKSTDLGKLLPRRSSIDDFDNFKTSSGLLSASILSLQELNLSSSVRIRFKNQGFLGENKEVTKCAFWKYSDTSRDTSSSVGSGWSDTGCRVVSRNRSTTICRCEHMTDFAVLTQSIEPIPDPIVIVYIAALCLLIGALVALIRDVVMWCKTRRERVAVLIHECLAFVLAAAVFLLALFLHYHEVMCIAFAALLHWFVLAIFCWILAEFIELYLCINFGWNRSSSRLKYFIILGWVAPLILVAITLAVTRENDYGSKQWCWYSDSSVILLTYVCPIALCILLSIVILLKIGCLKFGATDDSEKKDLSVIMVLSAFLIPLVLCTFTAAKLSADRPDEEVFQYLFAVFCIFLGIYIMVYHCWLDREIVKLSIRKHVQRARPKRDYYRTNETVMYSEGTSEGKSFSLIFPSRKSPTKKAPNKSDRKSAKRSDSSSPFDYNSTMPMYPAVNDSSLKSFKSQVSTQQHTLDTPPNTLSAITISRPNSQCIELTSLSDLDRRPDGAEQIDSGEPGEFYGSRHSNPMDSERQRTSGCSNDMTNASTFGKEKVVQKPSNAPASNDESKNRISGASSAGISRTSRSSVSGASITAGAAEENVDEDAFEDQPFIRHDSELGPEIRSDPPAKIPKRRKRGSRRRLDDEYPDDESNEPKIKTRQSSSTLPSSENSSVKLKNYTSF